MSRREAARSVPARPPQQDAGAINPVSEVSRRITESVEIQGRLQSAAAQYAASVTARRAESAGQVAGVGEVELICAWLAGYEARQRVALAEAQSELNAALREFSPPQRPDPT